MNFPWHQRSNGDFPLSPLSPGQCQGLQAFCSQNQASSCNSHIKSHIINLSTKLFAISKALSKFQIFTKAIIAQSKLLPRVQGESCLSHSNDVTYPIIIGGLGLVPEDSPFIIAQEKLKCLDKLELEKAKSNSVI